MSRHGKRGLGPANSIIQVFNEELSRIEGSALGLSDPAKNVAELTALCDRYTAILFGTSISPRKQIELAAEICHVAHRVTAVIYQTNRYARSVKSGANPLHDLYAAMLLVVNYIETLQKSIRWNGYLDATSLYANGAKLDVIHASLLLLEIGEGGRPTLTTSDVARLKSIEQALEKGIALGEAGILPWLKDEFAAEASWQLGFAQHILQWSGGSDPTIPSVRHLPRTFALQLLAATGIRPFPMDLLNEWWMEISKRLPSDEQRTLSSRRHAIATLQPSINVQTANLLEQEEFERARELLTSWSDWLYRTSDTCCAKDRVRCHLIMVDDHIHCLPESGGHTAWDVSKELAEYFIAWATDPGDLGDGIDNSNEEFLQHLFETSEDWDLTLLWDVAGDNQRLISVPHGIVRNLPWSALLAKGSFTVERVHQCPESETVNSGTKSLLVFDKIFTGMFNRIREACELLVEGELNVLLYNSESPDKNLRKNLAVELSQAKSLFWFGHGTADVVITKTGLLLDANDVFTDVDLEQSLNHGLDIAIVTACRSGVSSVFVPAESVVDCLARLGTSTTVGASWSINTDDAVALFEALAAHSGTDFAHRLATAQCAEESGHLWPFSVALHS